MRALAFNCSPKMEKGNTALILGLFLEGMKEAGAEVELLYTKKLEINPYQGELSRWLKTPGKCFQKDDMEMLLSKLNETDMNSSRTTNLGREFLRSTRLGRIRARVTNKRNYS